MAGEVGLIANVLENGRFHLAQYGHIIFQSLNQKNTHNWMSTLLAANYWRIRGKPKEAIECLRKSINSAPVQFKHLGLLSLANVFHRSHNSQVRTTKTHSKTIAKGPDDNF
jgi:hypothetical protein